MALTKIGKEGVTGISNSSNATAITIDSSGNVGIGTAAPDRIISISGGASADSAMIRSEYNDTGYYREFGRNNSTGFFEIRRAQGGSASTDFTIDLSGDVLVGATSTSNLGGINPKLIVQNSSDGIAVQEINSGYAGLTTKASGAHDYYAAFFENSTPAKVGGIYCSTTSTSFQTSSDYRLKENVTATWDATTRLKQLNPVRFNFIADADTTVDGFLAHEVQTVVPEAIGGTHNQVETWTQQQIDDGDAPDGISAGDNKLDGDGNTIPVYQGIDQSKLVPLLVKTIQELEARIVVLENA